MLWNIKASLLFDHLIISKWWVALTILKIVEQSTPILNDRSPKYWPNGLNQCHKEMQLPEMASKYALNLRLCMLSPIGYRCPAFNIYSVKWALSYRGTDLKLFTHLVSRITGKPQTPPHSWFLHHGEKYCISRQLFPYFHTNLTITRLTATAFALELQPKK